MEVTWENHVLPNLSRNTPGSAPSPLYVELIAMAERLYNHAITGSAAVLTKGLMFHMWPTRAVIDQGMPMFSPALRFGGSEGTTPLIDAKDWPVIPATKAPMVASKRTQEITYGLTHFYVRHDFLCLPSIAVAGALAISTGSNEYCRCSHCQTCNLRQDGDSL